MKSFKEFITEKKFSDLDNYEKDKWVKIPNSEFDSELASDLFDLIDKTYSYVGGHANYRNSKDIPFGKDNDDPNLITWYGIDFDDDQDADIVRVTKLSPYGEKSVLSASDGSKESKIRLVNYSAQKLQEPGNYAEVSDAIMHILLTKYGVPTVDNQEDVEKILGKKVTWIGQNPEGKYPNTKGFYSRKIGGEEHIKVLVGKPKIT